MSWIPTLPPLSVPVNIPTPDGVPDKTGVAFNTPDIASDVDERLPLITVLVLLVIAVAPNVVCDPFKSPVEYVLEVLPDDV